MIKTINYKNKTYPQFQTYGNASQFAVPYAKYFCNGIGVDVGCKKTQWSFPGSMPVDLQFKNQYHALNLPQNLDYIYSSHCLQHTEDWVAVMQYWYKSLKEKGILFLYLPDYSQQYWRPWNNKKHKHVLHKQVIKDYMQEKYINVFCSQVDLNNSYMIVGEKDGSH